MTGRVSGLDICLGRNTLRTLLFTFLQGSLCFSAFLDTNQPLHLGHLLGLMLLQWMSGLGELAKFGIWLTLGSSVQ